MKIGILTFHSQLNYGGVLQCWALQNALTRILSEKRRVRSEECAGRDEVVVIDRWLTPDNCHLERGYNHYSLRQWIRFWLRVLTGGGDFAFFLRCLRTKRFLHTRLRLTPYHFYDWSEISNSSFFISHFSFDSIVVGSDQVWHCGDFNDPRPYFLEGFSASAARLCPPPSTSTSSLHIISYAASFGFKYIPEYLGLGDSPLAQIEAEPIYRRGLARFAEISCREAEGVRICKDLGFAATHVVDPTLLLPREAWSALGVYNKRPKHVVCYSLGEPVDVGALGEWAQRTGRTVTVINDGCGNLKPFPKSPMQLIRRIGGCIISLFCQPRVRVVSSFGPREFYRAFAEADECITNSFHAVMFSYICNCNVRFLRPATAERMGMFARIKEFATTSVKGSFITNDLPAALVSLDSDERISFNESFIRSRREFSRTWLADNLV